MSKLAGNEIYGVSLLELLTLYVNVLKARKSPSIGYMDADTPFSAVRERLNSTGTQIKEKELEAALWACVMMEERKKFWHPEGLSLKAFISKLLNARGGRKVFHTMYSHMTEKIGNGEENAAPKKIPTPPRKSNIRFGSRRYRNGRT